MRLYVFDPKHDRIISKTELGELSAGELGVVRQVVDHINENGPRNRYRRLVLANKDYLTEPDEDGNTFVGFE